MRRMRRPGRLRSGWRRTGICGRRTRCAVTRRRWRSGGRSWNSAARPCSGPRPGSRPWPGFLVWLRNGRTVEHALAAPAGVPSAETLHARLAALISFYQWQEAVHPVPVAGRLLRGRAARMPSRGLLAHLDARRGPGPSSLVKVRRHRPGRAPLLLLPAGIQAIIDGCATWDDAAGDWKGNLRDRLLFAVLAESGMRLGEVLGMAISDFVMGCGGTPYIEVVPRAGNPNGARVKMMRPRRIYVSADLERLFADYLTHLACRAAGLAAAGQPGPPAAAGRDPGGHGPGQGHGAEEEGHRPGRVDSPLVQAQSRLGLAAGRHPGMGGLPPPGPRPRADHYRPVWLGPGGRGAEGRGQLEVVRILLAGARWPVSASTCTWPAGRTRSGGCGRSCPGPGAVRSSATTSKAGSRSPRTTTTGST
jgi:integrase